MKIIMIVPFDLARNEKGEIVVGPETKIACDRAIELARKENFNPVISAMAGRALKWDNVWMGDVIRSYVQAETSNLASFMLGFSRTFNTTGEMKSLARLVEAKGWTDVHIVLAVKWWHATRAKFLCKYWLRKYKVKATVSVSSCESHVSWLMIVSEFLGAWPKNLLRVAFGI